MTSGAIMAKRTVIVDDIDGTENAMSYRFSLAGDSYEIDLCPANLEALQDALKPYVTAARLIRGYRKKEPTNGGAVIELRPGELPREQRVAIRNWAREHGYDVAERG